MTTNEENEQICEKLLGWKQSSILGYWFPSPCHVGTLSTPSFTTWAEAGLILEALVDNDLMATVVVLPAESGMHRCRIGLGNDSYGVTGPLAIRAAALEYLKAVKT